MMIYYLFRYLYPLRTAWYYLVNFFRRKVPIREVVEQFSYELSPSNLRSHFPFREGDLRYVKQWGDIDQSPTVTMYRLSGDCEDISLLIAWCLYRAGYPAYHCTALNNKFQGHSFCIAYDSSKTHIFSFSKGGLTTYTLPEIYHSGSAEDLALLLQGLGYFGWPDLQMVEVRGPQFQFVAVHQIKELVRITTRLCLQT